MILLTEQDKKDNLVREVKKEMQEKFGDKITITEKS